MDLTILDYLAERVAEALDAKHGGNKPPTVNEIRYFTVNDVCRMLHISEATYYRHKDLGYIVPAKHVGRKPLFTQDSIDAYLNHFEGTC